MKPAAPCSRTKAPRPRVADFHADPLFPRIERACRSILAQRDVVAPVDLLVSMQLLSVGHLEDWRRGQVPYLEQVIGCNLTRLSRLLRILRLHAHDLNLVPVQAVYRRHGKGPRQDLRFTKTGDLNLEAAYARHFVRAGRARQAHGPAQDQDAAAPEALPAAPSA